MSSVPPSGASQPGRHDEPTVRLTVDGREVRVPAGSVVAAAVARAGVDAYRRSVLGEPRAPLCGMGICFECRVTINERPHRLSCQTICEDGMKVTTR
jgi:predicted molibdopterin-dependent oxidoreductase YjgC